MKLISYWVRLPDGKIIRKKVVAKNLRQAKAWIKKTYGIKKDFVKGQGYSFRAGYENFNEEIDIIDEC